MNKFIRKFYKWSSPKIFYRYSTWGIRFALPIGLIVLGYGLYNGLFVAPADYLQGDAFRIIYVHAPCAMLSLFLYSVLASMSFVYLIWHVKLADIVAEATAKVGALFTFLALVTGAIWGKPMWGTWWVWDARLTSELILLFIYLGYLLLRKALMFHESQKKASAILALIGFIDIPIIHFSVNWWYTLHQPSTITKLGSPSIDNQMLTPLIFSIVGFFLIAATIVLIKSQTELLKVKRNVLCS